MQIMALPDDVVTELRGRPGVEFVTMTRDLYTERAVRKNLATFHEMGLLARHRTCEPIPLSPLFFSHRTQGTISEQLSGDIYTALKNAGYVDLAEGLLLQDPRESQWRAVLNKAAPAIEGIEALPMEPDESALSEVMNVAWAMHEMCSSDIEETLSFFHEVILKHGFASKSGLSL